ILPQLGLPSLGLQIVLSRFSRDGLEPLAVPLVGLPRAALMSRCAWSPSSALPRRRCSGLYAREDGPGRNLWFTEFFADAIGRVPPAGIITEFRTPTAGSAPIGITAGPDATPRGRAHSP